MQRHLSIRKIILKVLSSNQVRPYSCVHNSTSVYTTVRISAIPTFLSKTSSLFFSEQARRQKTQRPPPPPLPPARLVRRLRDDGDGPQATGRRLKKPASARRRARIFLGEESHRPLRETSERPPRNNGRSRHALRELRTPPPRHGTRGSRRSSGWRNPQRPNPGPACPRSSSRARRPRRTARR